MSKNTFNIDTVGTGIRLLSFGTAISAMKDGKRVQRRGWNGKGLFIFMQVPSEVPIDIVPKMSSLPEFVKDEFKRRFDEYIDSKNSGLAAVSIKYSNQMAIVDKDNNINGWSPSSSDTLSDDWVILD